MVLTWNDPDSFVALMAERGDEVAAVLTEPAVFNTGCILPEPGYLELLRSETRKYGALLIFDEVITGFRFARGGAQEWFGVLPDITTLAKGLGGGFPVAAVGGTVEAMRLVAEGVYSHSGTYNANVVQCAAVSATMDVIAEPGLYERQRALGFRLAEGLSSAGHRTGLGRIRRGLGHRLPAVVRRRPHPQLAGRRRPCRRGVVHPLVSGDGDPRRAVPPAAVREPVRLAGAPGQRHRRDAHRRRRRAHGGGPQPKARARDRDRPRSHLPGRRPRYVGTEGGRADPGRRAPGRRASKLSDFSPRNRSSRTGSPPLVVGPGRRAERPRPRRAPRVVGGARVVGHAADSRRARRRRRADVPGDHVGGRQGGTRSRRIARRRRGRPGLPHHRTATRRALPGSDACPTAPPRPSRHRCRRRQGRALRPPHRGVTDRSEHRGGHRCLRPGIRTVERRIW